MMSREGRAERLQAYIEAAYERPMDWETDNCTYWPAEWVYRETGRTFDLPACRDRDQAQALIRAGGTLDRLWKGALYGFDETGRPGLGDVGVIDTGRFGQVGGIFLPGQYFAWRGENTVAFILPRFIVRAWALP